MDARQLIAMGSLGLVGALVIGLLATSGDAESPRLDDAASADPLVSIETGSSTDAEAPVDTTVDATSTPATSEAPVEQPTTTLDPLVPDLASRGPHPPLLGIEQWLQSDIASLDELRGKVVAVQFWTFGCSNCKATLPHMRALHDKYAGDDFEIVGVHAPEFEYESDPDAVAQAAVDLGVTWPIALDTEKRSFRSWQTERRFWPRLYLIDRDGNVRYDKIGEGKYDEIDAAVGALIDGSV